MNYQVIAYSIFLSVIAFITFRVGWVFYKNGEVYLKMLMPNDHHLVKSINKMLLVGYYLVNLGFAAISIHNWELIMSLHELLAVVATHCAMIILLLGMMHYFNMFWLLLYSRYKEKQERTKELLNQSGGA